MMFFICKKTIDIHVPVLVFQLFKKKIARVSGGGGGFTDQPKSDNKNNEKYNKNFFTRGGDFIVKLIKF